MQVLMFNKNQQTLTGSLILTTLEDEGVVFYCQDKAKNRYRVPKADVLMKCNIEQITPTTKKGKKRRKTYAN
jgi:hypothetical protein